jgi:hypothetical protein
MWIAFYNRELLHEELGDIPPVEVRALHREKGREPNERPSGLPSWETQISIETNLSAR